MDQKLKAAAKKRLESADPDVSGGEAFVRGGVDAIPFGQKVSALGTAGILKLVKQLSSNPAYQNLDDTYEGQLARSRSRTEQATEQHPYATAAGNLVGGTAAAMAPGGFASKAKGAGGLLERSITAGLNAARYGGLHGLGSADGEEALERGGLEAASGLALGTVGNALAEKVATMLVARRGLSPATSPVAPPAESAATPQAHIQDVDPSMFEWSQGNVDKVHAAADQFLKEQRQRWATADTLVKRRQFNIHGEEIIPDFEVLVNGNVQPAVAPKPPPAQTVVYRNK